MADIKTTATELSVALGIGGLNFDINDLLKITNVTSADANAVITWLNASSANNKLGVELRNVGLQIRKKHSNSGSISSSIEWSGGKTLTTGVAAAKDIVEHYGPVSLSYSVKADSNIIYNSSPGRLAALTSGNPIHGSRFPNWFNVMAPAEYQALFILCDGPGQTGYATVNDWDSARKADTLKRSFKAYASNMIQTNQLAQGAYKNLCNIVSTNTANVFQSNLQAVILNNPTALKTIFWEFFRLNSMAYILCGLEDGKGFAAQVLDKDTWNKQFKVISIKAIPKPAGQPEIILDFVFQDNQKNAYQYQLKIEIRWSHGKFCGNPEAKVYKLFSYKNLPWNTVIL